MKKLLTAGLVLMAFAGSAQTLFRYGNDSVQVKEFLTAYSKNNTGSRTEKSLREYLQLYIASRLKIKEARARGYDTLPQLLDDIDNLRRQILPSYLNDKEGVDKLVEEAFLRAQKEIHLAHIFIAADPVDSARSAAKEKKAAEAYAKLSAGSIFAETARLYSEDPSAGANGGDLNWITVFSLPYELENLAYNTLVGKISPVYRSKAGFHIFKNLEERKSRGRMKAGQILLAFPPGADEAAKAGIKKLADSIYNRLQQGDDFGKLAAAFSNDVISAAANGQIPDFGTGQYDPVFENAVFSLKADGAISKPFLTAHGYHIVKRLALTPAVSSRSDTKGMEALRQKVELSDRIATTTAALKRRILANRDVYKPFGFSSTELFLYTDSAIAPKPIGRRLSLHGGSPLFAMGSSTKTVADWVSFAQTFRFKSDGSGVKPYPQIWEEFTEAVAISYYQDHLEQYSEAFRQQLNEFKEGNLFFEIMQREVWGPAQTDTVALVKYFEANRSRYAWKKSADAVIFYANDGETVRTFADQLKKAPASWSRLVMSFSERISADSARFEWDQLPNPGRERLRPGLITGTVTNKSDNTLSFAYIIRVYNEPAPRSFAEARGLLINDYQAELERRWLSDLEKKYPVTVDEAVFKKIK
ncbi:MAG TPA: peptidylprolyl isomerase [Flavisolibacter sp.]|nr:peptidylprolyl isomerase [Flavisolibacter sp.]